VPSTNPLIDQAGIYAPGIESLIEQSPIPAAQAGDVAMNSTGGSALTQVNAAGTSENVAKHVAVAVVLLGVGIISLHKLGFRFAGVASVGFGK
jgi:hypothetical protein